eukprot:TRINITY_DN55099_c0_g1_i1.p1 TRINITY_DN55099_c0_g1~~TRINITY_DN55099_c0_g1_i1.p1  ORF type:complete len:1145 (-),score=220.22 TRINITY_DN55099_c0_g1_i1:103-3498(-)
MPRGETYPPWPREMGSSPTGKAKASRGRHGVLLPKLKSPPNLAERSITMPEPEQESRTLSRRTISAPLLLGPPPQHLVWMLRGSEKDASRNTTGTGGDQAHCGMRPSPRPSDVQWSPSRPLTPLSRRNSSSLAHASTGFQSTPTNISTLALSSTSGRPRKEAGSSGSKAASGHSVSAMASKQQVVGSPTSDKMNVKWSTNGCHVRISDLTSSTEELGDEDFPKSPTWSARCASMSSAVSNIAQKICSDLNVMNQEVERRVAWANDESDHAMPIDDPILLRAKQVIADSHAKATDEQFRPGRSQDTSFLRDIFLETRRVRESLNQAMGNLSRGNVRFADTTEGDVVEDTEGQETSREMDPSASSALEQGLGGDSQHGGARQAVQAALAVDLAADVEGVPDLSERLSRVGVVDAGFSEEEISRMNTAFGRFRQKGGSDVHKDDLMNLLQYLGHVFTSGDGIWEIYKDVTPYDYVDFDEFLSFMEKYVVYEHQLFEKSYVQFDEDGSGEMSKEEIRSFMINLHIWPVKSMFEQAWKVVDPANTGELDFDGFVRFLVVFRHCEGFTKQETKELRKAYDTCSDEKGKLPLHSLCDSLVRVFGVQSEDAANDIVEKLSPSQGKDPEGLMFNEFLILARRARELQHASMQESYASRFKKKMGTSDHKTPEKEAVETVQIGPTDGQEGETASNLLDGKSEAEASELKPEEDVAGDKPEETARITQQELSEIVFEAKYFPLEKVMTEVLDEVLDAGWDKETLLDFTEFFDFFVIYRTRDGFTKAEVREFIDVFNKFDVSGEQEISGLMLADIFRYLGYTPDMEEIPLLVRQVDVNGSNALDPREFLQLMQLYRKVELERVRDVFNALAKNGMLSLQNVIVGLRQLDHKPPEGLLVRPEGATFDEFVGFVDGCRAVWVAKQRRKAGYNDAEIEDFQDLFKQFDRDGGGSIEGAELNSLLAEFGWSPKSREEQTSLMARLDMVREICREAGVEETSKDGSTEVFFWEFVQLARLLQKQQDMREEEQMTKLSKELRFKQQEVDEFRQAFRDAAIPEDGGGQMESAKRRKSKTVLSRDMVRRFLRSLGLKITIDLSKTLDEQVQKHEDDDLMTDFGAFLILMRWVVDTDFADMKATTEKRLKEK